MRASFGNPRDESNRRPNHDHNTTTTDLCASSLDDRHTVTIDNDSFIHAEPKPFRRTITVPSHACLEVLSLQEQLNSANVRTPPGSVSRYTIIRHCDQTYEYMHTPVRDDESPYSHLQVLVLGTPALPPANQGNSLQFIRLSASCSTSKYCNACASAPSQTHRCCRIRVWGPPTGHDKRQDVATPQDSTNNM